MAWLSSIDAYNMSVYEAKYVLYHVPDVLAKCDMSSRDVHVLLQFVLASVHYSGELTRSLEEPEAGEGLGSWVLGLRS
jgi:hypothetical protein